MRHLSRVLLLLMLHSGFATAAGNNAELQHLYSALNMLNQQQQAIYQQFQMVQELRRSALPPLYAATVLPQYMGPPPNYDDVVAAQQIAIQRDGNLSAQADELLERYNEIDAMKKPLEQKIFSLTLGK